MAEPNDQQDGDLDNTDGKSSEAPKPETPKEPDWKAEAAKWKRIANKPAKPADEPQPSITTKEESSELDYGQKAFLKASGLKGPDEMQLAKDYAKRTGLDFDAVVEDDIFLARLDKLRTTKSNELAATASNNRGTTSVSGKTTPEYWLAKLGPNDQIPADLSRDLRQQIVEGRRAQGKTTKIFYND